MIRSIQIISTSFRMMWQELTNNKLRTILSLLGIIIGIFCIVGVLAVVKSMEASVQGDLNKFGTNTIYIQKWEWGGGSDYPWWKFINRPQPTEEELKYLQDKSHSLEYISLIFPSSLTVEYENNALDNINYYAVTNQFNQIQQLELAYGRYFSLNEFESSTAVAVVGYTLAEEFFDEPEKAIDKIVTMKNQKVRIIGVIKKQGKSLIGGWEFDESVIVPYEYGKSVISNLNDFQDKLIAAKGKEGVSAENVKIELRMLMKATRRLGPLAEDNFALNDISASSQQITSIMGGLTTGGLMITILSFIVGIFGVANIMFVTVKERTSMIGLKKAIGAKRRTILLEILLEAIFLCIVGGVIGLIMVFGLTFIMSSLFGFTVFVSLPLFISAILMCIFFGMLAGLIPAITASKLDPVVAIRS